VKSRPRDRVTRLLVQAARQAPLFTSLSTHFNCFKPTPLKRHGLPSNQNDSLPAAERAAAGAEQAEQADDALDVHNHRQPDETRIIQRRHDHDEAAVEDDCAQTLEQDHLGDTDGGKA
jgi:hypothetical protein